MRRYNIDPIMGEAEIAIADGQTFGLEITTNSGHFLYGSDAKTNVSVLKIGKEAFKKYGIEFS